jgi:ribose transport system ATP-binding protein
LKTADLGSPSDAAGVEKSAEGEVALAVRGVSKVFPGTRALDGVDLTVCYGEIHALCGGNGSGKSTLIKIVCGAYAADAGVVTIAGREMDASAVSTKASYELGVRVVHQDPPLFPDLSIAENMMLAATYPTTRYGNVRWARVRRLARAQIDKFKINAPPERLLRDLPVAMRTQVAIAGALQDVSGGRSIVILDEPTASLPATEVALLMETARHLASMGHAIIFVSHRLDEVMTLTDRVTVLRDGRVFREHRTSTLTEKELIESILGGRADEVRVGHRAAGPLGPTKLAVRGLRAGPLTEVSFEVRAGEVVGIAGLLGSGRTELLRAICGDLKREAGTVIVRGRTTAYARISDAIQDGVVLIPEDRGEAVFADMSVDENLDVSVLERYWRGTGFQRSFMRRDDDDLRRTFRVKAASGAHAMLTLSGGNQQKAILARWMRCDPTLLLLDEPTHGVDVGARADIYSLVREMTSAGGAAVVVTSDLEELAQFVDRALVLRGGRLVADVPYERLSAHRLNEILYTRSENNDD